MLLGLNLMAHSLANGRIAGPACARIFVYRYGSGQPQPHHLFLLIPDSFRTGLRRSFDIEEIEVADGQFNRLIRTSC
ncbi:unnamed protein product [Dicrocoelium dendriticum]|nr:unnamed protein product [Dicrocoelium dendriticum]